MAKHKPEDPWAGFVDVLSNILMVVVFLVVILGVAIFALSQQITKAAVAEALKEERAHATEKSNGEGNRTLVDAGQHVNLPENKTGVSDRIIVPDTSTAATQKPPEANQQQAALTLSFSKGSFTIDPETRIKVEKFLTDKGLKGQGKIVIYSFASSTADSVSEARRIAFYRAMEARTALLDIGIKSSDIELKIFDAENGDDADSVRFFPKGAGP